MERDVCDVNDSKLCGLSIGKVGDEEDKNMNCMCRWYCMKCRRVSRFIFLYLK